MKKENRFSAFVFVNELLVGKVSHTTCIFFGGAIRIRLQELAIITTDKPVQCNNFLEQLKSISALFQNIRLNVNRVY